MGGLARIAKALGGITIQGKKYVWDYAIDKAVPEEEMPVGSKRHEISERCRFILLNASNAASHEGKE